MVQFHSWVIWAIGHGDQVASKAAGEGSIPLLVPSSSGLRRSVVSADIAGSNPVGTAMGTKRIGKRSVLKTGASQGVVGSRPYRTRHSGVNANWEADSLLKKYPKGLGVRAPLSPPCCKRISGQCALLKTEISQFDSELQHHRSVGE